MLILILVFGAYLFIFSGLGMLVCQTKSLFTQSLIGGSIVSILLYFWHFVAPSTPYLLLFFGMLASIAWWRNYLLMRKKFLFLITKRLASRTRLGLLVVLILVFFASVPSNVPDEGLYYAQSILWFEHYGWVKGLANFDYHLGQGSALHALESVFNLGFLNWRTNDLAAFFLMLALLDVVFTKEKSMASFIGIAGSTLFFGLISADNTDVLMFVIFYQVWFKKTMRLELLAMLIAFAALSKMSSLILIPLLLVPFKKRGLVYIAIILGMVLFKSWYLTGYPLYPFINWQLAEVAWQIPKETFEAQSLYGRMQAFHGTDIPLDSDLSVLQALFYFKLGFDSWFFWLFSALNGIWIFRFLRKQEWQSVLNWIPVLFFMVWLLFAPQVRLALPMAIIVLMALTKDVRHQAPLYLAFSLAPILLYNSIGASLFYPRLKEQAWQQLIIPAKMWDGNEIDTEELGEESIGSCQPRKGQYCFYACFPCRRDNIAPPFRYYHPQLLGETIEHGFGYVYSIPKEGKGKYE